MEHLPAIYAWSTLWLFVTALLCAGLAYQSNDRSGTRACLKGALLSWTWPVTIPLWLLFSIWKMFVFAFERK